MSKAHPPELKKFMDKRVHLRINGGREVSVVCCICRDFSSPGHLMIKTFRWKVLSVVLTPSWTWCWTTLLSSPSRYSILFFEKQIPQILSLAEICNWSKLIPRKRRTRLGWWWSGGTVWWCWRLGTAFRRFWAALSLSWFGAGWDVKPLNLSWAQV